MLPDRDRQLLTAYVDGELSSRQRRHVARLLHRSREARELLKMLQADSGQLRRLNSPPLNSDLTFPVLRTITERRLSPRQPVASNAPGYYPAWTGIAAAAAVLLVVGLGSFLYFASSLESNNSFRVAGGQKPLSANPSDLQIQKDRLGIVEGPKVKSNENATLKSPDGPSKPSTEVVQRPDGNPEPPDLPAPKEEVATAPSMEMFKLESAHVALPVTLKLRDLDQDATRQKLLGELKQDTAFRLELPCKDGSRAFERLQNVWKAQGNSLVIDQAAQARLKRPQWKTNYVLVAEDFTPEELHQLMQHLAAEDKKGDTRKPPDALFDHLVVTRMTKRDYKELSDLLLGADLSQSPVKAGGLLGTDPKKPLSDVTADQVAKALTGEGGTPRPEPGKPTVKTVEHQALTLAYNPVRPRPGSNEIKRFLDGRKPTRPGTVLVLLVLRGPGS